MSIGTQLTIPQLKAHLSTSRLAVGLAGELLLSRALEKRGYKVATTHQNGDLSVITPQGEVLYVEVKTSRRGMDGRWQFTLYKHWQGRTCADHRRADTVALLCILKTGDVIPFIVPISALADKHKVTIPSWPVNYSGWLAPYRQTLRKLTLGA